MIESLLYVTITRLDIMQVVGCVARFQVTPKDTHVHAVKRIFTYLKGTMDYGLQYLKCKDFTLTTYTNVDWGGLVDDRKSTSGGAFFVGGCLVSWQSKKQASTSLSIAEMEYIAAESCCTQVLWMNQTLRDIKVEFNHPIFIFCDNTSAINISKNPVMYSMTKHIPIKYHFLREQVSNQEVRLEYVPIKEKITNLFTKPLPTNAFERLRQKLGVISLHH